MKKLAFLVSNVSPGSNLRRVVGEIEKGTIRAAIAVVISDAEDSKAIQFAKEKNIPTIISKKKEELIPLLRDTYPVDYILLAGWKRIIPQSFIDTFQNKILNVHPGIIPDTITTIYPNPDGTKSVWARGKLTENAIQEVLNKNVTYAGSSIHFLTSDFDFGPVLERCFEKVEPSDTIESLYNRLKEKENSMYISVLQKLCN